MTANNNEWHFYACRLPSRTWLHRDLPLTQVTLTPALSGPQSLSAVIPHLFATTIAIDGQPLIVPWSTFIIAEKNDVIQGGGFVSDAEAEGGLLNLTIDGFSAFAKGAPQLTTLSYGGATAGLNDSGPVNGAGTDPIQIMRDLWAQLQAYDASSQLGVVFTGNLTSAHKFANWHNVPNIYSYTPDASTVITITAPSNATTDTHGNYPVSTLMEVDVEGTSFDKKTTSNASVFVHAVYWDYYVYCYNNTDIGSLIDTYAVDTPFDWLEQITWVDSTKQDFVLAINVGYPRLGTTRDYLRFVEGENIIQTVQVASDADNYANACMYIGAGSGATQLKAIAVVNDGNARKWTVQTDTTITNQKTLQAAATRYLNSVAQTITIDSITLKDHPHAPFGSFAPGDDIIVQVATGWFAGLSLKCRVISITFSPDTGAYTVTLKRSDSFSYSSITISAT